jgi:hypothetical protein
VAVRYGIVDGSAASRCLAHAGRERSLLSENLTIRPRRAAANFSKALKTSQINQSGTVFASNGFRQPVDREACDGQQTTKKKE